MSQVINEIQLDFSHSQNITIPAVQFDNGSRFVRVHLQNNKRSVNVTGTQIVIMAIRHDLEEVIESCRILDANNGIIEFEISEAMTEKQGDVLCQLKLFDNADLLNSQIFKISVKRSLMLTAVENCHCQHLDGISNDIRQIQDQVVVLQGKPDIDDNGESRTTVWSSAKTKETITTMITEFNPYLDLSSYQTKTDQSLNTTNKNVVGAINEVNSSVSRVDQNINSVTENVNRLNQTVSGVTQNINGITQTVNDLKQSVGNGKQLIASAITDKGIDTSGTDSFEVMANKISQIEIGHKGSSLEIHYGANEPQDVGNGAIWIPKLTKDKVKSVKITSEELPPNADSGSLYCRYTVLAVERYPLVELGGLFECRMFNFSFFTKGNLDVYEGFVRQNGQWIRVYNLEPFKYGSATFTISEPFNQVKTKLNARMSSNNLKPIYRDEVIKGTFHIDLPTFNMGGFLNE